MKVVSRRYVGMLVATTLASAGHVLAGEGGSHVGNGGDVLVCKSPDSTLPTIELLDYYEARNFLGIQPNLGATELPVSAKVELVLARLSQLDPAQAQMYSAFAKAFHEEARFVRGITLVDVPDSQHIVVPGQCEIHQLVVQQRPLFPEDRRYTVNQDLWEKMSADQQAGVILHEVIYRRAIELKQTNSKGVRYFNGKLAALDFGASHSASSYQELQRRIGFDRVTIHGADYSSVGLEFYQDGTIKSAKPLQPVAVPIGEALQKIHGQVEFYPDQSLKGGKVLEPFRAAGPDGWYYYFDTDHWIEFKNGLLKFEESLARDPRPALRVIDLRNGSYGIDDDHPEGALCPLGSRLVAFEHHNVRKGSFLRAKGAFYGIEGNAQYLNALEDSVTFSEFHSPYRPAKTYRCLLTGIYGWNIELGARFGIGLGSPKVKYRLKVRDYKTGAVLFDSGVLDTTNREPEFVFEVR